MFFARSGIFTHFVLLRESFPPSFTPDWPGMGQGTLQARTRLSMQEEPSGINRGAYPNMSINSFLEPGQEKTEDCYDKNDPEQLTDIFSSFARQNKVRLTPSNNSWALSRSWGCVTNFGHLDAWESKARSK